MRHSSAFINLLTAISCLNVGLKKFLPFPRKFWTKNLRLNCFFFLAVKCFKVFIYSNYLKTGHVRYRNGPNKSGDQIVV